jgi:glycerol-3-phosphate cytidylyltransferase-like family protein
MDKRNLLISVLLTMVLVLTACQAPSIGPNETANGTVSEENATGETGTGAVEEQNQEVDASKASYKITATEGDLVKIPVKAVDFDTSDVLKFSFSKPFNDQGMWLTKIGDEGQYLVKVSVSDGLVTTSEYVLVDVKRANRAPVVDCPDTITVQETETVSIDCNIYDEEGDPIVVGYEGWMRTSTYKTNYGDAGSYTVVVRARDPYHETTKKISVIVEKKNRAPVIEPIDTQYVTETETFTLKPDASDPDGGDSVQLYYSVPLNSDGSWTPTYGDRGDYTVTVTATDGKLNTTETFTLVVEKKYRAPVLKAIDPISVMEGDEVSILVQAYDPDGEPITITYSGWKDTGEFTTTYDDAYPNGCATKGCTATYIVTVTVSNGVLSTSQDVVVKVTDKNRPPEIIFG